MKISWKTSLLAIGVLGLLAAVTVPDAMAGGRGHSGGASHGHVAPGSRSVHGRSGNLTRYDRGRFGGRNRDFRRPWYGDRFGRYGYGFYSSYGLPSYTYYPGCYGLCAQAASRPTHLASSAPVVLPTQFAKVPRAALVTASAAGVLLAGDTDIIAIATVGPTAGVASIGLARSAMGVRAEWPRTSLREARVVPADDPCQGLRNGLIRPFCSQ